MFVLSANISNSLGKAADALPVFIAHHAYCAIRKKVICQQGRGKCDTVVANGGQHDAEHEWQIVSQFNLYFTPE